ncbi:HIT zinc finger family protein [Coccidioides posadasii C735 delta SOWgp]|uniref:HIT zinc finger family protein n=1 Tax=Coccidioides posadasii (strain C735) TaxID=222929 RepID=C5PHD3_COCP7|nr:HIT zinc finger family protein [Coccidioides posadasii C735 delta SOWgp]EER23936.1 HIT zinc finger family protein [Coccidioides posadasii C735 delta SOWgp]|eukprot:XP_003066081.1 HIT zinc finger family protein [Coccidioides posadasii C735 delta SOWgp]
MSHLIEVLPTGTSHTSAPGWAYVPDIRPDIPRQGRATTAGRKRGVRDSAIGRGDISSKQQNAILRRLAELDRDNPKDVHIPIPTKQKDSSSRGSRGKTTSNVRRILMSQKAFKNYLDDEEAAVLLAPTTAPRPNAPRAGKTPPTSSKTTPKISKQPRPDPPEPVVSQLITSEFDNDPLLRSYIPSAPSERIVQALLSEPPLTYKTSRATFPDELNRKRPRQFCGICGYWGKLKCIRCQARVCGLECQRTHDETACGRIFA